MQYSSVVTSKGTITIPAEIRRELCIKPGQIIDIQLDKRTNTVRINPVLSLDEVRLMNQKYIKAKRPATDDDIDRAFGETSTEGNVVE